MRWTKWLSGEVEEKCNRCGGRMTVERWVIPSMAERVEVNWEVVKQDGEGGEGRD